MKKGVFPYMMLVQEVGLICEFFMYYSSDASLWQNLTSLLPFPRNKIAGYTEIVQLLISHANEPERVKKMLETVDTEGDTVSL